ncbi:hypothetical protein EBT16_10050 [bacterium]|nr:hypothetical protein [bacterium]
MPNHITNTVTFSGTENDLNAIRAMMDRSKNTDGTDSEDGRAFDFNAILPMPKSLEISKGTETDVGLWLIGAGPNVYGHAMKHASRFAGVPEGQHTREELCAILREKGHDCIRFAEAHVENIKLYGYADWYDWACDKWGTKWNSYRGVWYADHLVRFETAWTSPRPVFAALSKLFPNVTIDVLWTDEGEEDDKAHRYVFHDAQYLADAEYDEEAEPT